MRFILTPPFAKAFKSLAKKYPSITSDFRKLRGELEENPYLGVDLGNNCRKIRLAITSKGRGKSGGARVITHVETIATIEEENVVELLYIYDKADRSTLTDKELSRLLQGLRP